ncbi:flagellar export protein FliJ [Bdellovibrio sp. HCB2-146]|uniref:flagellar export protein FliJ n=1 Tax=Bdellovibrio sp. HCB2-146 TaxID=3394362 RepID=UPI0039BC3650
MKFKFPLQKVLEHRKLRENLVKKDFQEAQSLLNEQVEILNKMNQDVANAYDQIGKLTKMGGAQGPALEQIHEFLKGQRRRIHTQEQKVQEFEKLVEAKREILRQAAQEYKIMEKMRENKFEDYRQERLAQEQKENDEQSILRFKAVKES